MLNFLTIQDVRKKADHTMSSKSFYSCIDPRVIAPQPEQHKMIKSMATDLGGKVVFYGSEDYFCAERQPFIFLKLSRTPDIDGVIFFTFDQFTYGRNLNSSLIKEILNLGISINFARENISILTLTDFHRNFILYRGYHQAKKFKSALVFQQDQNIYEIKT